MQSADEFGRRLVKRFLAGKAPLYDGVNDGKQVFGAMIDFAGEQLLPRVRLLALGYVAGNFRCADDPAVGVPDGRHREGNVDEAAVLVHPHMIGLPIISPAV